MATESQEKQIKDHLIKWHSITPMEALRRYGCFRLGARIYDLRRRGVRIRTAMIEIGGKRFAKYIIEN